MTHFNKFLIRIITSIILASTLLLLAGCNQRNIGPVTTTQYKSYLNDEDVTEEDWTDSDDWEHDTTSTTTTTLKKTESVKKDWKQAYIDYIYELEDSYDGIIVYYPCGDFTGDGISDFICSLNKNEYESDKEIAVAYYDGGVATLTSDIGFLGVDPRNNLIGVSTETDGHWSIENDRVRYYKLSNGEFVYAKTDKSDVADHTTGLSYLKYEMINEIKNGNI